MSYRLLENAIRRSIRLAADDNGIAKLADIGNRLREQGVDYKALGWLKLSMLLQEYPNTVSLWNDTAFTPPVTFARWIGGEADESRLDEMEQAADAPKGEAGDSSPAPAGASGSDDASAAARTANSNGRQDFMDNDSGPFEPTGIPGTGSVAAPACDMDGNGSSAETAGPGDAASASGSSDRSPAASASGSSDRSPAAPGSDSSDRSSATPGSATFGSSDAAGSFGMSGAPAASGIPTSPVLSGTPYGYVPVGEARASYPAVPIRRAPSPLAVFPGNELTRWAYLVHIPSMLEQLASLALPEHWNAPDASADDHAILMHYLKYTFVRLRHEDKILEDFERRIAAFNTGLVDRRYEPIYAVFEPNPNPSFMQKWKLSTFCIAGEDTAGKRLVGAFNPLPKPASYFRTLHDMFYDITAPEPIMDYEHILLENVGRLPREYLSDYCSMESPVCELLSKSPYEAGLSEDAYNLELARRIKADIRYYRKLIGSFREAVGVAIRRVRWNYRSAIPMYYPTRNILSLLVPLALVEDGHTDVALVVERLENGNYLGHTILTLPMAYSNARLVCRLESDWLRLDSKRFGPWPEL